MAATLGWPSATPKTGTPLPTKTKRKNNGAKLTERKINFVLLQKL
jgi:hypothetical protein